MSVSERRVRPIAAGATLRLLAQGFSGRVAGTSAGRPVLIKNNKNLLLKNNVSVSLPLFSAGSAVTASCCATVGSAVLLWLCCHAVVGAALLSRACPQPASTLRGARRGLVVNARCGPVSALPDLFPWIRWKRIERICARHLLAIGLNRCRSARRAACGGVCAFLPLADRSGEGLSGCAALAASACVLVASGLLEPPGSAPLGAHSAATFPRPLRGLRSRRMAADRGRPGCRGAEPCGSALSHRTGHGLGEPGARERGGFTRGGTPLDGSSGAAAHVKPSSPRRGGLGRARSAKLSGPPAGGGPFFAPKRQPGRVVW